MIWIALLFGCAVGIVVGLNLAVAVFEVIRRKVRS